MLLPLQKGGIRDLKAEAGKLRPGETGSQWLLASLLLCTSLVGKTFVPSPISTSSAPQVPVWGTDSPREPPSQLLPSHGMGIGPAPLPLHPKSQSAWAGFGVICLPHHKKQHLCSCSASALLGLGRPGLPPRHPPRLPAVPTRCQGTHGQSQGLKHQLQRWEELSPDNQRRLFSYCAVS